MSIGVNEHSSALKELHGLGIKANWKNSLKKEKKPSSSQEQLLCLIEADTRQSFGLVRAAP